MSVPAALRRHAWTLAAAAAVAAVAAQRLAALGEVPPGLHSDEASIGYNAWALAHHGVDEHGSSFPLFIEAFGEYKNPLYVYLLAPFTWVLPLTSATVRLPAALCGLAACLLLAHAALRLTRSRAAALATLATCALTPWAVVDARVGVEAPALLLCLAVALACAAHAFEEGTSPGWAWATGLALAAAVLAYSSGRLLVVLVVAVLAAVDRRWRPGRRSLPLLLPVAAVYALLGAWAAMHPGALTRRLAGISILSDQPGPLLVVGRFVRNYLSYTGVPFLFGHGDANLRYATGFGGMLLVVTVPAVATGVAVCIARRREPACAMVLALLLLAPVPAALTNDGTPQSLRAIGMLPALLLAAGCGWAVLLPLLASRRLYALLAAAAVCVEAGWFLADLYTRYPDRALAAFDGGELAAVEDARALAGGHRVLLSASLDQPYVMALFAFRPAPPSPPVHAEASGDNTAYHDAVLAPLGMLEDTPQRLQALARPGDVLVLAPGDAPPPGATPLERVTLTTQEREVFGVGEPVTAQTVAAVLYRR